MKKFKSVGEIDGNIILEIIDEDSKFKDIQYYMHGIKFAEEENPDGSMNMSFDYELHRGSVSDEVLEEFKNYIGDIIIEILEEQVAKCEVVYAGGTDESKPME